VLVAALRVDYRTADLNAADRAMLDYVDTLTRRAIDIGREDVEQLRSVGFDDTAILQINLIASWFNYINRVADGLGVGRP
jgi:uncharacterized peroxidase-related enzyme